MKQELRTFSKECFRSTSDLWVSWEHKAIEQQATLNARRLALAGDIPGIALQGKRIAMVYYYEQARDHVFRFHGAPDVLVPDNFVYRTSTRGTYSRIEAYLADRIVQEPRETQLLAVQIAALQALKDERRRINKEASLSEPNITGETTTLINQQLARIRWMRSLTVTDVVRMHKDRSI